MGARAMKDDPRHRIAYAGVRGPLRLEDLLFQAKKANRLAPLQVLRADRVVGEAHLQSAAMHTWRAFDEQRNQADQVEVEFLRYVAGKRTIKEAIAHMGVPDGADGGIVVALGEGRQDAVTYFVDMLGLVEDDALLQADEGHLRAFGITDEQLTVTAAARRMDLALEAVAAVDLLR